MLTLIAVFCNRFRYTQSVVEGILNQNFRNLRIIFIDNGSTDETLPFLRKSTEENSDRCTLISHPTNIGKPVALDNAIRSVKTRYVLAMDGDILLPKSDIVTSLLSSYEFFLSTYPSLALLSPRYNMICPSTGTPDNHIDRTSDKVLISGKTFHIARNVNVAGGCQLFPKHYYTQIGGYTLSSQYYGNDDVSFFVKLRKAGLLSVYADDIRIIHLGDEDVIHFPVWREVKARAHTSATQGKIYKDHSKLFI